MSTTSKQWIDFWAAKDDPLHGSGAQHSNVENLMARELALLLSTCAHKSVVEIGCGNGEFFDVLGFSKLKYVGYDVSEPMLQAFRSRFPGVNARLGSLQEVRSLDCDFVFSSGVIQYVSDAEFAAHLKAAAPVARNGGVILHAFVPWRAARKAFWFREIWDAHAPLRTKAVALSVLAGVRSDSIGNWYDLRITHELAESLNLRLHVFGSLAYPYRVHLKFTAAA